MKLQALIQLKRALTRLRNSERGSAVVELAIVFPILLMLFVGAAEIGRLFYTYTTLAKATKVGARYLSQEKDSESQNATTILNVKNRAARLVVCGFTDTCVGRLPIVPGLNVSDPLQNVNITLPPASSPSPKYVRVEITGFTFQPGVFNVAGVTNSPSATFYFALEPATRMRYMH